MLNNKELLKFMNKYLTPEERSNLYKSIRYQLSLQNPDLITLLIMMDSMPRDSKKAKKYRKAILDLANKR